MHSYILKLALQIGCHKETDSAHLVVYQLGTGEASNNIQPQDEPCGVFPCDNLPAKHSIISIFNTSTVLISWLLPCPASVHVLTCKIRVKYMTVCCLRDNIFTSTLVA